MNEELIEKGIINNEFDYSNIIPTTQAVEYLVKHCDQVYNNFIKLVEEDETKNKEFKLEYQEYQYKKTYKTSLEVYIYGKSYSNYITCKDYETFASAIRDGNLNNVRRLEIRLNLCFKRGKGNNLEEHENEFYITFQPYEIKFTRKSNHNDPSMQQIENQINTILSKFLVVNSIFCNKENE